MGDHDGVKSALGLTGPRAAPTLQDYQRELTQGSGSSILADAATHLWTLGQAARSNPRLVVPWMQAAKYAVEIREDLAVRALVDAGTTDRLAALCEPEAGWPGVPEPDED